MKTMFVISRNTFRSCLRDRILYAFVGFGVLYLFVVIFLGALSLNDITMIRGFGLAGIYLFGVVIAIFLGSSMLAKEIDERTLYLILSKPASRREVILGKFLGLLAAVSLTVAVMTATYLGVVMYQGGGFDGEALLAALFQILETALVIAFSIFISMLSTSLSAAIYSSSLVFVGHLIPAALENAEKEGISGIFLRSLQAIYYVFPNLEKFDIRNAVAHNVPISPVEILGVVGYAAAYIALLLYLANILFKRIEL